MLIVAFGLVSFKHLFNQRQLDVPTVVTFYCGTNKQQQQQQENNNAAMFLLVVKAKQKQNS